MLCVLSKAELTDKEKAKMRRQAERRAFSSLNPSLKQLLTKARSEINSDRQRRRLLGLWSGTAAGNPQALTGAREALAISMKEIQQEQLRVSQQLQTAEEDEEEGEDEEAQVVTSKSTKKQSTRSRELLAAQHQVLSSPLHCNQTYMVFICIDTTITAEVVRAGKAAEPTRVTCIPSKAGTQWGWQRSL